MEIGLAITNFASAGLMLVLGLIIKTGRASFLIAGYNTMSPGEQARIDGKKMSRFVGMMLIYSGIALAIGGILAIFNVFPLISAFTSWGLLFVIIIGGVIYMNVRKPFNVDVIQIDTSNPSKRIHLKQVLVICVGLVIGLSIAGFALIGGSRPTDFILNDTELRITGMYGETIAISDIQGVVLQDSLPTGLIRTNGAAVGGVLKGNFEASGTKMKIFADTSSSQFIYLYTESGDLFIINHRSSDDTNTLYLRLKSFVH